MAKKAQKYTTREVAKVIGLKPNTVVVYIKRGMIVAPKKDKSWHYAWTVTDIRRTRKALNR